MLSRPKRIKLIIYCYSFDDSRQERGPYYYHFVFSARNKVEKTKAHNALHPENIKYIIFRRNRGGEYTQIENTLN